MSEGDTSGGGAAGGVGGDEEAAWRELVARYETPVDVSAAPVPWPDREDLHDGPVADDGAGGADGRTWPGLAPGAGRMRVIRPATEPSAAGQPAEPAPWRAGGADPDPADDTAEHFIPPPPPPMPQLDPVAKGAWTALFGGPAYLFVSTLVGWTVPGWAAFLAVAAFIGGFAVIVLRLGDRPSRRDGPDDGAIL